MAKYAYTFRQEIRHDGLNKYRVVTAKSRYELNQKVAAIQIGRASCRERV